MKQKKTIVSRRKAEQVLASLGTPSGLRTAYLLQQKLIKDSGQLDRMRLFAVAIGRSLKTLGLSLDGQLVAFRMLDALPLEQLEHHFSQGRCHLCVYGNAVLPFLVSEATIADNPAIAEVVAFNPTLRPRLVDLKGFWERMNALLNQLAPSKIGRPRSSKRESHGS